MLVGGIVGYRLSASRASLIAGTASALLLGAAFLVARSGTDPSGGLWFAAVIALALCVVFALRFSKTKKFMPAGMLMIVSILALGFFTMAARG
jgi:uncharacterized membrane protein (UPF0136 family)